MLGRSREIVLIEDGACGNDHGVENSVVNAVNEGNGYIGNFDRSDLDIVLGVQTGDFTAVGADEANIGSSAGVDVDGVQAVSGTVEDLSPEELVGLDIEGHGLNVVQTNAGRADSGRSTGLKVYAVQGRACGVQVESVRIALRVDREGHGAVRHAGDRSNVGDNAGCEVNGRDVAGVGAGQSVHGIVRIVISHCENAADVRCIGAGVCDGVGLCIHDVEPGVSALIVIEVAVDVAARERRREGGGHAAMADIIGRIIIREFDPLAVVGAADIIGIVAIQIDSGQSLGNGYGRGAGNLGNGNAGNGDGGGTFGNTGHNAVCVDGRDGSIGDRKGNALVIRCCGENLVNNGGSAACRNGNVFNVDGVRHNGLTNVDVIDHEVVAGGVDGAVLLVGPGKGVLTCGQSILESFPVVLMCAVVHKKVAVDVEAALIPIVGVVAAFAPSLIIKLDDVAFCSGDCGGDAGFGACNACVAALRRVTRDDPGIGCIVGESQRAAFNVQGFIDGRRVTNLGLGGRGGHCGVGALVLCHCGHGDQTEDHSRRNDECEELLHFKSPSKDFKSNAPLLRFRSDRCSKVR